MKSGFLSTESIRYRFWLLCAIFLTSGILAQTSTSTTENSPTQPKPQNSDDTPTLVVEELRGFVNTEFQEFSPSLSPDGMTLYFYSKRDRSKYTDIFQSKRKPDDTWDYPSEIPELNSDFDDQAPFVTKDGRFLFLSSNRDGSYEARLPNGKIGVSRDIYASEWKNKKWSQPTPLPEEVNSDMIEENPHYQDGLLLFTRYPFGRPDLAKIYASRQTKDGWSQAKILPKPINDGHATIAAALSDDGKILFFASNRPGGFGGFDLYSIAWDGEKPQGEPENLGSDFNTTGDEAYFSYHRSSKTILFARRMEGKSFDLYSAYIPRTLEKQLEEDEKISLDTIHFARGSYELLPESKPSLEMILNFLKKNPNLRMKVIGHTDLNGSLEDNMTLSRNRAKSVVEYLKQNGIGAKRLESDGKGPKEPLFSSLDEEASRRNRRTEFQILKD